MQLLVVSQSNSRAAAGRQLSHALRLEAYFRRLLSENHSDEVFCQWSAACRLVESAREEYVVLTPPRDAARNGTTGRAGNAVLSPHES